MTKKAILIGINYSGDNQLYGCINDIIQMKSILIDIYGFQDSDILTLRDDDPTNMPTKRRILSELVNIVQSAPEFIYIHYSGHGTNITDTNKDEKDGRDECIVPSDHSESGIISDDELNMTLVGIKSTGIAVFDCCRSGTILDLPFELINTANAATTSGGLYCFSGCLDNQLATETFADVPGLPQGAMTAAFISVLRKLKYYPAIGELYSALKGDLKINGFEQIPYITSTVEITPTTPFPYIMQSNPVNEVVVPESGQVPISANLQVIPDISSNLVVPESIQVPISVIEKTNTVYTTMLETNIRSLNSQISTMNSQNVKLNSEIANFIKNMHIIALKNNKLEAYVRALVKQIPGMYIVEAGSTGPTGPQVSVELPVPVPVPVEIPVPQVPVEIPVELPAPVDSQVPIEIHVELPAPVDSQVPIEIPVPAPVDSQVPIEIPLELPAPVDSQVPIEIPVELPAPVDSQVPTL